MSGHSCPTESHCPREESHGRPPAPEPQVQVSPDSAAENTLHTPPGGAVCGAQSRPACGAVCSTRRQTPGGAAGGQYVRLNVGGALFLCPLRVLTRRESRLRDMFRGKTEVMIDREGWVLIDRSGRHFGSILNFLRDGSLVLPKSRVQVQEILNEAKYYGLQGLVLHCQSTLQKGSQELPLCVIPVVTSRKEEDSVIRASTKPVVKLVYNRSNNKYSYTSSSDDNLLKNIELFERLSLKFSSRVQFIKNVIGDEICCWSFYGQGRKLNEVCCTSIVYSTEKKHTKVEFPEARIYEETLNTLLYETVPLPDHTLLEATRRRYNPCGSHSEEEEGPGPGLALL
ncbi:BTB/POZ domain-containing adapter for CUL3-mediated RhoA degradation protein 2-like [Periophthalmus magnuspinnatus]|uniref:BTB/POZ domain-containing adapter for CUL3-mediated RhoA degradation protein 2-like n=1 Tax=Periophthalmus magnuspinnatus TaxID=409849 RepID=UPI00145BA5A2|nr:BTB/POZ domain-containing adapter for CUL3-mediated RhoA degradation protein 2-like [Periophthalmus magnuspinnatus]